MRTAKIARRSAGAISDRLYATNICFCKEVRHEPDEPYAYIDPIGACVMLAEIPEGKAGLVRFDRHLVMDLCGIPHDYHVELKVKAPNGRIQRLWSGTLHWGDTTKPSCRWLLDLRGKSIIVPQLGIYEFLVTNDGAEVATIAMPFVRL